CDHQNNDLQGSDGSGSLGGPDVRRRIPIKLISKQPLRSKPPLRVPRPGGRVSKSEPVDDDNFGFKQEERFDCGVKDVYGNQRRFPQVLFWDFKLNLVGERDKCPIHFCDKCGLPIHLYGRMVRADPSLF
uniref:Cbl proto-oncogene-like 1, E3 ubiquitin protein ligase n=1 Tax=Neogobius melanostomus TaxID=47308 RepID=A0A8C6TL04_9GOBI